MDFQFYFFFNLPNNNVGGSVNQSIIKKGLSEAPLLELLPQYRSIMMLYLTRAKKNKSLPHQRKNLDGNLRFF